MRLIGHLPSEHYAQTFSDFLIVQGISNEFESDSERWGIWIHSDDELARAGKLLDHFQQNPEDPMYHQHTRAAQAVREKQAREAKAAAKRHFDRRRLFTNTSLARIGPLTFCLIAVCLAVAVLSKLGENRQFLQYLLISVFPRGLPEILSGQVWRLITPVFLHFTILHILFNMLWLFDLGGMIERKLGTLKLALMVATIGVFSNVGQYLVSGPIFGGMSGVVYGLLGFVWMKGKFDPASGLHLHQQTMVIMLVWFFLCLTGWLGNIANAAHAVGLVMGLGWGYLTSPNAPFRG